MQPLAFVPVLVIAAALATGCGSDGESTDTGGVALAFEAEAPFLDGFEHDTGYVPAGSPAQVRAVARGGGTLEARAGGHARVGELIGTPGSGELSLSGRLTLDVYARVDTGGVSWEGPVDTYGYSVPEASVGFDPFLIEDGPAVLVTELPPEDLVTVPLASVPGGSLILSVAGGSLTTRFEGSCAALADGLAQFRGAATTDGEVQLSGTVVVSVPLRGDQTFGPFPITVPVRSFTQELDLGTYDSVTGEPATGDSSPCGAGPTPRLDAGMDSGGGGDRADGGAPAVDAGPIRRDAGEGDAGPGEPDAGVPELGGSTYNLPSHGGSGGRSSTLVCAPGEVVVGYRIRARSRVEFLALLCAPLREVFDGSVTHETSTEGVGTYGGGLERDLCEPGHAVTGIAGRSGSEIDMLRLRCTEYDTSGRIVGVHDTPRRGGWGGSPFGDDCSFGHVLIGAHVRSGDRIDRIQGICQGIIFP